MVSTAFQVLPQSSFSIPLSSHSSLFHRCTSPIYARPPCRRSGSITPPTAIIGPLQTLDVQADFSSPIASGSFGEVFFGTLRSGEPVVLKRAQQSATARALFAKERDVNARLSGKKGKPTRWPDYLGVFSQYSTSYLVWRRSASGQTLEHYLSGCAPGALGAALGTSNAPGGRLQAAAFRSVVEELLRATEELRAAGVVHRDVKPENILVVPGNTRPLQLIDFGSACDIRGVLWNRGIDTLDPLYAPPEKRLSLRAPDRFDVFSIALIGLRVLLPSFSVGALRQFRVRLLAADCSLYRVREEMNGGRNALGGLDALFERNDPVAVQIFETLAGMLVKSPADRSSAKKILNTSSAFYHRR